MDDNALSSLMKGDVWQYTNETTCPGISGKVDGDIGYRYFEHYMIEFNKNGFEQYHYDESSDWNDSLKKFTFQEIKIWDYLISLGINQFGTAVVMGIFYDKSKLLSSLCENNIYNVIGLTSQEYIERVNEGIYKNFINDNI